MRKIRLISLWLVAATFLLMSCSKENVENLTPQVTKHEVAFNFFEKAISDIETRGDTQGGTSLADSKLFTELEVVLVSADKESAYRYEVRQNTTENKNFGNVKVYVPSGKYKLIAVAAKTNSVSETNRINIKSATEVVFPNNIPSDMAYICKDITIDEESGTQTFDCTLQRGISVFKLIAKDVITSNLKSITCTISGKCGNVFNPSTGYCKSETKVIRTVNLDREDIINKRINIMNYVFLSEDDTDEINITVKTTDKDGKTVKEMTFKNVHLVKDKQTTYLGPIFTNGSTGLTLTISELEIEYSGYGQEFE